MAYVSQDTKAKLAPGIKAVLKRYKMKGTVAVRHNSTLTVNLKEGSIDFGASLLNINTYHIDTNHTGVAQKFLTELVSAMKGPDYFDHSDIGSDYFFCSHYVAINIGKWDKPYIQTR
jgi:hypothetical protein